MEYGNYMMIVMSDSNNVIDRSYSDIKSAYEQGCMVALKTQGLGGVSLMPLMELDESVENAYTVKFMSTSGIESYTANTSDGFASLDDGGDGGGGGDW